MAITSTPIKTNWSNYSNKVTPDALPADPDILITNPQSFPVDIQADLILQGLGGTELLYYARHDTVNGQKTIYQPLKDVTILSVTYSPQSVVGNMDTWKSLKDSFPVDIDAKQLPETPESSGSSYVNPNLAGATVDLIIELEGLMDSDVVEIAVASPVKSGFFSRPISVISGGSADQIITGTIDGGNELGYNIDMLVDGGSA